MEVGNLNQGSVKQRHGCVTAWLILMIVVNSITAAAYLFLNNFITEILTVSSSSVIVILLGLISLANVFFSVLILQWKKTGFWGFCGTSIAALVINLYIGIEVYQSVLGLLGIAVLYAILQFRKNESSAWDNLE